MKNIAQKITRVLLGLLGLTLLVVMHEFGHFIACKLFGVHVFTFSIGFDPALFTIRIGETNFQLGALPIGGYVSQDATDLMRLSLIKQLIIIIAGVAINILFSFGVFKYLAEKKKSRSLFEEQGSISTENSEGIESDATLLNIKERNLAGPEKKWRGWQHLIRDATPSDARTILQQYGDGIIGPFGIVMLLGQTMLVGFDVWLYILAIISLNLGVLNLLPLPFLDGGQALSAILEALGRVFNFPPHIVRFLYIAIIIFVLYALSLLQRQRRRTL